VSRAIVKVSAGVFSTRQVIVGRVFVDTNGNQHFDEDDRPMPGVRLYLSNGQSVITDSEGLYNFPSLGDGPQVISLDPVSLPPGYALTDGGRESGKAWTRLLRTPVGGGALLRQNLLTQKDKTAISGKSEPLRFGAVSIPVVAESAASPVAAQAKSAPDKSGAEGAIERMVNALTNLPQQTTSNLLPRETSGSFLPAPDSVSMAPGAQIEARTELN
jgi:hypothetical protein